MQNCKKDWTYKKEYVDFRLSRLRRDIGKAAPGDGGSYIRCRIIRNTCRQGISCRHVWIKRGLFLIISIILITKNWSPDFEYRLIDIRKSIVYHYVRNRIKGYSVALDTRKTEVLLYAGGV